MDLASCTSIHNSMKPSVMMSNLPVFNSGASSFLLIIVSQLLQLSRAQIYRPIQNLSIFQGCSFPYLRIIIRSSILYLATPVIYTVPISIGGRMSKSGMYYFTFATMICPLPFFILINEAINFQYYVLLMSLLRMNRSNQFV